jgi:hypothetical protein
VILKKRLLVPIICSGFLRSSLSLCLYVSMFLCLSISLTRPSLFLSLSASPSSPLQIKFPCVGSKFCNIHIYIQSNLSTTAKKWPLYRGGCSVEGFQSKLVSKLAWPDFVRPLLTGGRYSEVAVNTGLTVLDIHRDHSVKFPLKFDFGMKMLS